MNQTEHRPLVHAIPCLLVTAAVLCLTAVCSAQEGPRIAVDAMRADGHSVRWDGGRLLADSPAYKARFDRSGIHFTPTLGPTAPRNFPVQLVFDSIRRGSTVIETGSGAEPSLSADVVSIPRGSDGALDIIERYEVRDTDIEQSFVFRSRPAGTGDLIVRLRVHTELAAKRGEGLETLSLTKEGLVGGVKIGAVTGFDADGDRVPGHMNFDGDFIELVLPARFVDAAAYPLVLDPVIGGIFSGGASFQDRRPDIAYDATNDFYLLVWEIHRSATDVDIWATRLKSDNTGRTGLVVVSGTGIQSRPSIANIASTDMYMVVWQDNAKGNWDVRGRAVDVSTKAVSAIVTIAGTTSNEITPDIAGEATSADDDAVCVWDDEGVGIRAVEIEVKSTTSVTVGTPKTLAVGKAPLHDNPAISKSGGARRRVAIVWEAFTSSIALQAFTMDLAPASAPVSLPLTNQFPDVDGDGTDFAVVFQRPESSTSSLGDIWCWAVSVPATVTQPMRTRVAPRALAATSNDDEAHPTVSFVGSRYVAVWADREPNSTTSYRCHIQNLLPDCTNCGSGWRVSRSSGRRCEWPAIASHFSGGATTSDQAWILFQQEELSATPPRSMVMVARYDAVVGGPVQTIANSCGGGGTLSISGAFSFGEKVTFQLRGADTAATSGIFVAGVPSSRPQFPCATCQFLLGPIMVGLPLSAGGTQLTSTIPCDMRLLDYDLDVQVIVLGTTSSPCAIVLGLSASNILRARVRD